LKAELKEKGINKLTSTQLKKAVDKNEEEHHSIRFLYKADKSHYEKLIEQMENDI